MISFAANLFSSGNPSRTCSISFSRYPLGMNCLSSLVVKPGDWIMLRFFSWIADCRKNSVVYFLKIYRNFVTLTKTNNLLRFFYRNENNQTTNSSLETNEFFAWQLDSINPTLFVRRLKAFAFGHAYKFYSPVE